MKTQCNHINRLPIAVNGKFIGAPSVGRCQEECLPGMVVCYEHATKYALAYGLSLYARERDEARAALQKMESKGNISND